MQVKGDTLNNSQAKLKKCILLHFYVDMTIISLTAPVNQIFLNMLFLLNALRMFAFHVCSNILLMVLTQ